jgi:beta-lactamase class A
MSKKLSYTFTLALVLVSCFLTYLIDEYFHSRITDVTNSTIDNINSNADHSDFTIGSIKGYKFIKPIVTVESNQESESYTSLKNVITSYIDKLKGEQKLYSASVYLTHFEDGSWMSVNPNESYHPASMMKVANLLTFLRMDELYPHFLDKHLVYNKSLMPVPEQTFNSKQIEDGKSYSIRELLKYMILYSDNNATNLLMKHGDDKTFFKLFRDLKVPLPETEKKYFLMTAQEYSTLFKVLYNSSYLSFENSEYAIHLLTQSDFKLGMVKELPAGLVVAHKFGEMKMGDLMQLHETGLIYFGNTPYLLTIMTKGKDIPYLANVISTISKMAYDDISRKVQ